MSARGGALGAQDALPRGADWLLAMLWGARVLGERPDAATLGGAALVAASTLAVVAQPRRSTPG